MITYPTIFFSAGGKVQEDFEDYSLGALPSRSQGWQHEDHQWLTRPSPNKYAGFTWKDYGVSGAFDDWDNYSVGSVSLDESNLLGEGNFDIRPWVGFSAPFYRDTFGNYASADQLKGYDYINFDWGADAPFAGYKTDSWSARFIGKLNLPISGTYRLYVERDQACRIYVGKELGPETLVFNQWGTAVPVTMPVTLEPSTTFSFDAGAIDILIQFYEDAGLSKLRLYWSKPTVPGGGPVTPPEIILPSDFGDSGYVRVYAPYVSYENQGNTSLDFQGAYRTGYVWTDRFTDDSSRTLMDVSGNYSYGIKLFDSKKSEGRISISHAGYYLDRFVPHKESDQGVARVNTNGFYAYKAAFATASDLGSNLVNPNGHYSHKNVTQYDRHYSKTLLDASGSYVFGLVNLDAQVSQARHSVTHEGYYANRYLAHNERSQGGNTIVSAGSYFSRYFYASVTNSAETNVLPSGYYITGQVNHHESDLARNTVNPAGHKVYHQVTGDLVSEDKGRTALSPAGFYVERYVIGDVSVDAGGLSLDPYGVYYPRYLNNDYNDPVYAQLTPLGIYYNIYASVREQEPAYNLVAPQGYHIYKNVHAYQRDYGDVAISQGGNYVTGWVYPKNTLEHALNNLAPAGNYFLAVDTFGFGSDALNSVDFTDSYYRSIFNYVHNQNYAFGEISPAGLYYWSKAQNKQSDGSYEQILLNGSYLVRFVENRTSDNGSVIAYPSGHYAEGYLYPTQTDFAASEIQMQGNQFYRYASGSASSDAFENLDLQGLYFGRYFYIPTVNLAAQNCDILGAYSPRYPIVNERENVNNLINHNGLYYNRYSSASYDNQGGNFLNVNGELVYSRVALKSVESAYSFLSFEDSQYFSAVTYPQSERNYGLNDVRFDGTYLRDIWIASDSSTISIDFGSELYAFESGISPDSVVFTAFFSGIFTPFGEESSSLSTLDYWLEFSRRPTYNMSLTQKYFSI